MNRVFNEIEETREEGNPNKSPFSRFSEKQTGKEERIGRRIEIIEPHPAPEKGDAVVTPSRDNRRKTVGGERELERDNLDPSLLSERGKDNDHDNRQEEGSKA